MKNLIRTARRFVLAAAMAVLIGPPVHADVGPPVKIVIPPDKLQPATSGSEYLGTIEIKAGAAGQLAAVVRALRYPVAGIGDAARRDFPWTIVMYRNGFRGEAERLAKDLGLARNRTLPLDGMRPADLGGAQLALIVGNAS